MLVWYTGNRVPVDVGVVPSAPVGRWIVGGTIYAAAPPFLHFNERNSHTCPHPPMAIIEDGPSLPQGRRKGASALRATGRLRRPWPLLGPSPDLAVNGGWASQRCPSRSSLPLAWRRLGQEPGRAGLLDASRCGALRVVAG